LARFYELCIFFLIWNKYVHLLILRMSRSFATYCVFFKTASFRHLLCLFQDGELSTLTASISRRRAFDTYCVFFKTASFRHLLCLFQDGELSTLTVSFSRRQYVSKARDILKISLSC
jgi:hypothetical protein